MFFKKENKQNRKGMNLYAIIGGIALAAILGLVVAPRLSSAQLPGYRSNIQSDMNSMQELIASYASNHQGSTAGLFNTAEDLLDGTTAKNGSGFDVLIDEGIMDGSMASAVAAASATAGYSPRWARGDAALGDLEIRLGPVANTPGSVNVLITINANNVAGANEDLDTFTNELANTAADMARDKYGNFDGTATALTTAAITGETAVADVTESATAQQIVAYTIR